MATPIVDTHVHYWEPESPERPYDPGGMRLGDPVSVEDLLAAMEVAAVDKIIQVTPSIMGWDNRYALKGAARYPDKIRVFGRFDPTQPDIAGRLKNWIEQPYAIGLRFTLFGPQSQSLTDGTLEPFWVEAEKLDVPVAVYASGQAKALGEVGRRHPGLRLLVDHLTLRYSEGRSSFEHWPDVLDLVHVPNVYLKVSYLPEATSEQYPFPEAQGYLRQVYERFGPDRMIWGSNYLPTLRVCSYKEALDFVREACNFIPLADREKILGGTAIRVLGLPW